MEARLFVVLGVTGCCFEPAIHMCAFHHRMSLCLMVPVYGLQWESSQQALCRRTERHRAHISLALWVCWMANHADYLKRQRSPMPLYNHVLFCRCLVYAYGCGQYTCCASAWKLVLAQGVCL